MPLDADSIGAVPYGPDAEGLLTALGAVMSTYNAQAAELLSSLDISSPTWDPVRPRRGLALIETVYGVRAEPTLEDGLRYRIARAHILARHVGGQLDGIIAALSALIGAEGPDPVRMRIIAQAMTLYVIFRYEDAPPAAVMDRVVMIMRESNQDVAGMSLIAASEGVSLGALFQLDIGPAFDQGKLATSIGP